MYTPIGTSSAERETQRDISRMMMAWSRLPCLEHMHLVLWVPVVVAWSADTCGRCQSLGLWASTPRVWDGGYWGLHEISFNL